RDFFFFSSPACSTRLNASSHGSGTGAVAGSGSGSGFNAGLVVLRGIERGFWEEGTASSGRVLTVFFVSGFGGSTGTRLPGDGKRYERITVAARIASEGTTGIHWWSSR